MVGIGGIGMSAIARWFIANDKQVAGYDKTETELTKSLATEGIANSLRRFCSTNSNRIFRE